MHPYNRSFHFHSVPFFYLIPGVKHKGLNCSTYVGKKRTYNLEALLAFSVGSYKALACHPQMPDKLGASTEDVESCHAGLEGKGVAHL